LCRELLIIVRKNQKLEQQVSRAFAPRQGRHGMVPDRCCLIYPFQADFEPK
jgi:hypothetical protein